jgi:hypothetical protein
MAATGERFEQMNIDKAISSFQGPANVEYESMPGDFRAGLIQTSDQPCTELHGKAMAQWHMGVYGQRDIG